MSQKKWCSLLETQGIFLPFPGAFGYASSGVIAAMVPFYMQEDNVREEAASVSWRYPQRTREANSDGESSCGVGGGS